jgi:hypothetical protein
MSRSSRDIAADHTRGARVLGKGGQELLRDIGGRSGGGPLDRPERKRWPTNPADEAVDVLDLLETDKKVLTRQPVKRLWRSGAGGPLAWPSEADAGDEPDAAFRGVEGIGQDHIGDPVTGHVSTANHVAKVSTKLRRWE